MESVFLRLSAWSVRPCTTSRMFGHFRISDRRWLFAKVVKGTVKMGNQTSDLVHIQSNVPLPHARQVIPRKQKPPVYDPLHGFPDGRKERGTCLCPTYLKFDCNLNFGSYLHCFVALGSFIALGTQIDRPDQR